MRKNITTPQPTITYTTSSPNSKKQAFEALMKYVVVIPAKNEEEIIGATLYSLASQTCPPQCVLVVDNDSTDKTPKIINQYSAKYDFIKYYNYTRENSYSLGAKIVRIFNAGKKIIDNLGIDYDYIVKMDADIILEKDVFLKIAGRITEDKYGIVSPLAFAKVNNRHVYVSSPDWHTLGDFKVYNRECLESMGGLKEDLGWDCADNISAIQLGYKTKIFRDIVYEQHRPIGRFSLLRGMKRQGLGAYKLRYGIIYLGMKAAHDLFKPPFFLGSFYYLSGYFSALTKQHSHTLTREQGKIFRKLLWKSFFERFRKGQFFLLQSMKKNNNNK